MQFLSLSWLEYHQVCFELAKKVIDKKIKFDRIVCISRGGLITARILSDFLKLPISIFTVVAYETINQSKEPRIVEKLDADISGETVLLVDEVADTGGTLKVADKYLKSLQPKKVYTLCPYAKPINEFKLDFWQEETDKWIVFPYEIRETVTELLKMVGEKKSLAEVKKHLQSLGFNKNQLQYILDLELA